MAGAKRFIQLEVILFVILRGRWENFPSFSKKYCSKNLNPPKILGNGKVLSRFRGGFYFPAEGASTMVELDDDR